MAPLALALALLLIPLTASAQTGSYSPGELAAARRVASLSTLAAEEYRLGVSQGRVVAAAEVDEARLFLAEARRNAATLSDSGTVIVELDRLARMVERLAGPDSVQLGVTGLVDRLTRRFGITLDEVPANAPSLARGREIYQSQCAACHGLAGRGDGPAAGGLSPPASNLTDRAALLASSPLDFYRRITVGTAGTAMAPYEHSLSTEDRWAVALYASTLRLPSPTNRPIPEALGSFATSARMTDAELLASLGPGAGLGEVAAIRTRAAGRTATMAAVFNQVRRELDSALVLARAGYPGEARALAMDAYITFERAERDLRVKDPGLTARIETSFESLRNRIGTGEPGDRVAGIRRDLAADLERAERTISDRTSGGNLLVQSFVILLREGLEAILVIGALMAFLVKTGNSDRRRDIHRGVGAAILLSLLTAVGLETVFVVSRRHQEGLEGGVMILAAATLFYISYWLISKMDVARWGRFVRSRMEQALTRKSALALGSVAFLAVYREGFETVLFYKALAVSGSGSGASTWLPILGGIGAGAAILTVVYLAINRFGVRLPLKPFFGVTGALLYYMAFVFAGKGIAELQEAGLVGLTPVLGGPRVALLGIYPTVESLTVQGLILLAGLFGIGWILLRPPAPAGSAPSRNGKPHRRAGDDPAVRPPESRSGVRTSSVREN